MRLYIIIILLLVLCYVDSKRKQKHGRKHRLNLEEGERETGSGFQKHSFETIL